MHELYCDCDERRLAIATFAPPPEALGCLSYLFPYHASSGTVCSPMLLPYSLDQTLLGLPGLSGLALDPVHFQRCTVFAAQVLGGDCSRVEGVRNIESTAVYSKEPLYGV